MDGALELQLKLYNGQTIPTLGFGTANTQGHDITQAVIEAIETGYRLIDCAEYYMNHKQVGEALSDVIKRGVVTRDDLYIVSKVWCTRMSHDGVGKAIKTTLDDLQLSYLDLYLIHWPFALKDNDEVVLPRDDKGNWLFSETSHFTKTWKAMEELVDDGQVRAIGVSNFNTKQLQTLLDLEDRKYRPAVNQVEIHPYFQNGELVKFCHDCDITIMGYSSLGAPYESIFWPSTTPKILDDPVIGRISKQLNKTPAQVILRWGLQRGYVVLVKSKTRDRIRNNFNVFDFELSTDDMEAIRGIEQENGRLYYVPQTDGHPEQPFKGRF